MTDYVASLANINTVTNAPLALQLGYINIKSPSYTCITKIDSENIVYNIFEVNDVQIINNYIFQVGVPQSYHLTVYDKNAISTNPIPFSVYAYHDLHINNKENILQIFSQELPTIYKNSNKYNYADNYAIATILQNVYFYVYTLYYNSVTSIGVNNSYNENWELIYIGMHNFLSQAKFPAELIKTLMHMGGNPSIKIQDISIVISKVMYQYTGISVPVSIKYKQSTNQWDVKIYYSSGTQWLLGVNGASELGVTTRLSSSSAKQSFLWFIYDLVKRLMPAYVKFNLSYFTYQVFVTEFNLSIVDNNDYYSENFIYDAYMTVNNNKNYNTKGFIYV